METSDVTAVNFFLHKAALLFLWADVSLPHSAVYLFPACQILAQSTQPQMWIKAIGLNQALDDTSGTNVQQSFQKGGKDLRILCCHHQRSHIIALALRTHSMTGFQKPSTFHDLQNVSGSNTSAGLTIIRGTTHFFLQQLVMSRFIEDVIHLRCSPGEHCLHQRHHTAFHVTGGQHEVQGHEHCFFADVYKGQHGHQEPQRLQRNLAVMVQVVLTQRSHRVSN